MNNYKIQRVIIVITIVTILVIGTTCLSPTYPNQSSGTTVPSESTSSPTAIQKLPNPTTTMPIPTIPTECVAVAKGAGTYLHIVSDSNLQPLSSISIRVMPVAPNCPITNETNPFTENTNASGWTYLGTLPANYYFDASLVYLGRSYNISIPQLPLYSTYATLGLPSGNLTITLCRAGICELYNQTTNT